MEEPSKAEPDLLPCPFCGGQPDFIPNSSVYNFCSVVQCRICGANTGQATVIGMEAQKQQVVRQWNRRAEQKVLKTG